jgi:tetratricopeptide (TPR) repeat protein
MSAFMRQTLLCAWVLSFAVSAFAEVSTPAQQRAAAEQFGQDITQALNQRDRKALGSLIDFNELMSRAADVQGLSGQQKDAYVRSASRAGLDTLLGSLLHSIEATNGAAKFMRVTEGKPPRSLVRIDMGDSGFSYLEFKVETRAGRTRTPDWFQIATGDLVSVTIGGINQMFVNSSPGFLERMLGGGKVDSLTTANFARIGELHRAGKYAEALPLFRKIPEPMASSRTILTLWVSTATLANAPDEQDRVLARMAKLFANDPAAAFMLIDYYYKKKDLKPLLATIDLVERRVGVDGVTQLMRSNAYQLAGDLGSALKYADEAIRVEPDRLDGYDTRATNLVLLGRFQEAVDAYRFIEQEFSLQFTREIFADPLFAKFAASRPFNAWLPR